ncbi:MAG: cytochrome b [Hyphomicrobiaceae bacterium]
MSDTQNRSTQQIEIYSSPARKFHWVMAFLLLLQVPLGLAMVYRGVDLGIFDSVTNHMYTSHKLIGVVLLVLIIFRFLYRLMNGAPEEPDTLEPWQKKLSMLNHWGIYVLLIAVPILGYLGTAYYGALNIWGLFKLPAVVGVDKEVAKVVLAYHAWAAFALLALVVLHIVAAIYHHRIRKDLVLARMLPRLLKNSDKA